MLLGDQAVRFLHEVQTIAGDICKSVLLDATLFKYKPTILAASMIFLGFQLQFEID